MLSFVNPRVVGSVEALAAEYQRSSTVPFPHIVINEFLKPEVAQQLAVGFPTMDKMSKIFREPMSYKGQLSDIATRWPSFSAIFAELQSDEFRAMMGRITGINALLPDQMLAGGGLHQSPRSGFLDLHVDANFHPFDKTMHRRVNILVYVEPGWQDEWGGQFEMWSNRDNKPAVRIKAVTPKFNRALIFNTTGKSWHGVSAVNCPAGASRKSRRCITTRTAGRRRKSTPTAR